jgi:arylsulfatase A-like enzyme
MIKPSPKSAAIISLAFALLLSATARAASPKPNILLILTDNTGWGDYGCYGGGLLRGAPTPRIDHLASQGLRLLNFNTEPQCTPSRAALLTGRFAIRCGCQSVPIGKDLYGLVPWEITLAEILSDAGYATGIYGKWHLGKTPGRWPTDQGFDHWYGIPNSTDESIWNSPELINPNSVPADFIVAEQNRPYIMESHKGEIPKKLKLYNSTERRLIDAELTRRAIDFMKKSTTASKPFFAYVPLTAQHYPSLPHPDFSGKSGHGDYCDMLMQTDHYLGQMLDALKEMNIEDNTLVIFCSDNGPEDPLNGDNQWSGWTGPWAGTYFTAMEGGLRAPFIIRYPGKIPAAKVSNEIVHIADIFPTLCALTGTTVPTDRPIDGLNMLDFFQGKRETSGREGFIIFVGDDLRAVKWHNWKWHFAWQETKYSPITRFSTIPKACDLTRDPREQRQVAQPYNGWLQYPMMKLVNDFNDSVKQYPNVPVGAPDSYRPGK